MQLLGERLTANSWFYSCVAAVFRKETFHIIPLWTIKSSQFKVASYSPLHSIVYSLYRNIWGFFF